jgi:hypothetical protein
MARSCSVLSRILLAVVAVAASSSVAHAYIDLAPTLAKITNDAPNIGVVEVVDFNRETHVVTLKAVRTLKGTMQAGEIRHEVAPPGGALPRQVMQWATPGSRAVTFSSRTTTLVCLGTMWYQVTTTSGVGKLGKERPDLPLSYYGGVSRLAEALEAILQNKSAVISVVSYNTDLEGAMFDLALNRQSLPGVVKVVRMRAAMNMPGSVFTAASNPLYFIGPGFVDEHDTPKLIEQLKSKEVLSRVEAADDLRTLGRKAKAAVPPLTEMLKDESLQVRLAATAALMRIAPTTPVSTKALMDAMGSADVAVRRRGASYAGYSGTGDAAVVEKLVTLLKDSDAIVRANAMESVSVLGPLAEKAVPVLATMLDTPEVVIDVADALGRIGPAAEPALGRLAKLLESSEPNVRWAAVRAMSQIGTKGAQPAIDFMVKVMKGTPNEVEGYNMMIYLALLGPVAQGAVEDIRAFRIKNPGLPWATQWAISPTATWPWNQAIGFDARGGRGGGGGGRNDGWGNLQNLIYVSYINGLGARLGSLSAPLATEIMENKAGNVPTWGYRILAADAKKSIGVLSPYLQHGDIVMRERATVALGYMGEAAEPAREALVAAAKKATNEKERRLMEWAVRQIDGEE